MALEQYILEKLAGSSRAWPAEQGSIADAIDRIRELRKGNTLGGLSTTDLVREGRKY
jgi:hypothetical protein